MTNKRMIVAGSVLVLLASLAGVVGWAVLMRTVNNSSAQVLVWVSGTVDEVRIVAADDPAQVFATIQTSGGQDATQVISLRRAAYPSSFYQAPPAQYVFIARQGESTYQSTPICCTIGLTPDNRRLVIRSLTSWEVSDR